MISYEKFHESLGRLKEQYDHYENDLNSGPRWVRPAVEESVIKRFETCYDCLHKVLRRHLIEVIGIAEVHPAPRAIFRAAHENGLLPSPVEQWNGYVKMRVGTAHDYSGEKAQQCLEGIADFLPDAAILYETLTGDSTER